MVGQRSLWKGVVVSLVLAGAASAAENPPFLDQGFEFDYTPSGAPIPVPTTAQCDSIPLSWSRGSFTTGSNPQAPYYIQVYTSSVTFLFPSVINVGDSLQYDWPVPYIPSTQYQICMFDSNGVSGGCQRMTTVVPAENKTLEDPPVCTNLTYPAGILDVEKNDHTGVLSQYGWVDQCTDISIQPKNGTPPFTLTVAPALHPPWNITSNDMSPINWTVQLSWGSPFFISLVDADGQTWAYGPLHSGGQGPTDCLSQGVSVKGGMSNFVAVGSGVGGLVVGLAVGGLAAWFLFRKRHRPYHEPYAFDRIHSTPGKDGVEDTLYSPVPTATHAAAFPNGQTSDSRQSTTGSNARGHRMLTPGSAYEIEPFTMPEASSEGLLSGSPGAGGSQEPPSTVNRRNADSSHDDLERPAPHERASTTTGQVYVVHHDGGRAPVTVYTQDGAEIIELPPRYSPDDPPPIEERRRAASTPRKAPWSQEGPSAVNR